MRTVNGMQVALFCDNHDDQPDSKKLPYWVLGVVAIGVQVIRMWGMHKRVGGDNGSDDKGGILSGKLLGVPGFEYALVGLLFAFEIDSLLFTLKDQGLAIPYWMWVPLALLAVWGGYLFYMKAKDRNAPENDSS